MINIVHVDTHYSDQRVITAVDIKLKFFKSNGEKPLTGHPLAATVSAAFFKTTLLTDVGKSLSIEPNPKRHDIINLVISFRDNDLKFSDIARFIDVLQRALDETNIIFG